MEELLLSSPLAAEILEKHRNSKQPGSQHLCAAVVAISSYINEKELDPSPAAFFAAIMSTLDDLQGRSSGEELAAICHLLQLIIGRVSPAVLRKHWSSSAKVLGSILESHFTEGNIVKPVLGCLGPVLAAMEPGEWPAAVKAYNLLLRLVLDGRPKVRKAAQGSLLEVLASIQRTSAAASATEAIHRVCQQVLPGPAAAAQAAAAATHKNRKAAEDVLAKAVADALHMIGTLKAILPLLVGPGLAKICSLLVKLFPLRQPLLTRHTADALTGLCSASELRITSANLADILMAATEALGLCDSQPLDTVPSLMQLLEAGFARLQEMDAGLCSVRLPTAVHALVPQLAGEQEGVRVVAARCLESLFRTCIDSNAAAAAVTLARSHLGGAPSAVENIASAIERALGARYQDAWSQALPVVSAFFEVLGRPGAPLAGSLLARVGEMAAGTSEAGESGGSAPAINSTMGAVLVHLGPEAVLTVLPLNLNEAGFSGRAEARTWLLPLMRQHITGANLGYWGSVLLPTGRGVINYALRFMKLGAAGSSDAKDQEMQFRALEKQIWATLPAFARWPRDGAAGLMPYLKPVISAFVKRPELRGSICAAIKQLCSQPCLVLKASGQAGPGFPVSGNVRDDEDFTGDDADGLDESNVPSYYTTEMAERDIAELRGRTAEVLTPLCDEYANAEAHNRGFIASTISAYALIADPAALHTLFKSVLNKYVSLSVSKPEGALKTVTGKKESQSEQLCTLLDLALALAPGVNADGIKVLFQAAQITLKSRDQALQKHGYKVLAYLCQQREDFFRANFQQIVVPLLGGVETALSAAKRFRLMCLQSVILALQGNDPPPLDLQETPDQAPEEARNQMIMTMLAEVVLSVKEVNSKTRAAAYEVLLDLAHAMEHADPASAVPDADVDMGGDAAGSRKGGLVTFFYMVLAGLAATSPHMQSASVQALARLVYEFGGELEAFLPELLPVVTMLARTRSREVVKSVLGFLKVCAMRLPVPILEAHMSDILSALLIWSEDTKNHFKLKVRMIVERLARRCGYDAVAAKMPEGDMRLLTHIRKDVSRKAKLKRAQEEGEDDGKSERTGLTRGGKTARRSEWAPTSVFSEERGAARHDSKTLRTGATTARPSKAPGKENTRQGGAMKRQLEDEEMLDLLDAGMSRRLVRTGAAARNLTDLDDDGSDFAEGEGGRLIIKDDAPQKRKRSEDLDGYDSADSDFDDLKNIRGVKAAWRSTEHRSAAAASLQGGKPKSFGGKSQGGKSIGGRSSATRGGRSSATASMGKASHSGERFRSKKSGGDVKGASKMEPYAYWPLDRKMLNKKRRGKQAAASKGLEKIVKGAKQGAAKGRKAKRQRT